MESRIYDLVKQLRPEELAVYFHQYVHCEARLTNVRTTTVAVSRDVDTPDGWVDGFISVSKESLETAKLSWESIFQPTTLNSCVQLKVWKFWLGNAQLKGELENWEGELKQAIKEFLAYPKSEYLLVLSWSDPTSKKRKDAETYIKGIFSWHWLDVQVRIWWIWNLAKAFSSHVSLHSQILGVRATSLRPLDRIAHRHAGGYLAWTSSNSLSSELNKALFESESNDVVAVYGEDGAGKTRFIQEYLGKIRTPALYWTSEEAFRDDLFKAYLSDPQLSWYVVIDDCDEGLCSFIATHKESFKGTGKKIILLTNRQEIFLAWESEYPGIRFHRLEKMEHSDAVELLKKNYDISSEDASGLIEISGYLPENLHRIGALVASGGNAYDMAFKLNKRVSKIVSVGPYVDREYSQFLLLCSCIMPFIKGNEKGEIETFCRISEKLFGSVFFKANFFHYIGRAKEDGIIRWNKQLQFCDPFVQLGLLRRFLVLYSDCFDYWILTNSPFVQSFLDHFSKLNVLSAYPYVSRVRYQISDSVVSWSSAAWVKEINCLLAFNRKSALEALKIRWAEVRDKLKSDRELTELAEIVRILTVWKDTFEEAFDILIDLVLSWNSYSLQVLEGLLHPTYWHTARSEVSLHIRASALLSKIELEKDYSKRAKLVAATESLSSFRWSIVLYPNSIGLMAQKPEMWLPKTFGELFGEYLDIAEMLLDYSDKLPEYAKVLAKTSIWICEELGRSFVYKRTIDILRKSIKERPYLTDEVFDITRNILERGDIDDRRDAKEAWTIFQSEITSDLASRYRLIIGTTYWEDYFDEGGKYTDTPKTFVDLAAEIFSNSEKFFERIAEMMSIKGYKADQFARYLWALDIEGVLFPRVVTTFLEFPEETEWFFLNFFSGFSKHQSESSLKALESIRSDMAYSRYYPYILAAFGWKKNDLMTEYVSGIADWKYPIETLWPFKYWRNLQGLPLETMGKILQLFHWKPEHLPLGADLLYLNFGHGHPNPKDIFDWIWMDIVRKFLIQEPVETPKSNDTELHSWEELLKDFFEAYPAEVGNAVDKLLGAFLETRKGYHFRNSAMIEWLFENQPELAIERIFVALENDSDISHYLIRAVNSSSLLDDNPQLHEGIFQWIDSNPKGRLGKVADLAASEFSPNDENSFTRKLLIKYGYSDEIARQFRGRWVEWWMGSESEHYKRRIEHFKKCQMEESEEAPKKYFSQFLKHYEHRLISAQFHDD